MHVLKVINKTCQDKSVNILPLTGMTKTCLDSLNSLWLKKIQEKWQMRLVYIQEKQRAVI